MTAERGFSVVVPIHNEAAILADSLSRMLTEFSALGEPFEILACENGSTDGSASVVGALRASNSAIRLEQLADADYGLALKHGLAVCRYQKVILVNVDFWHCEFIRTALDRLDDHDMVLGSKILPGSMDQRPFLRRAITKTFNAFLRVCFGFRGSDTHGQKAFRRDAIRDILHRCVADGWIFDTELVLRAERLGLRSIEVPVDVREIRQPSYWSILRRVPGTVRNLGRMFVALRSS